MRVVWQFLTRNGYRKNIVRVVLFKLIALFLLSLLFISFSVADQMEKSAVNKHYMTEKYSRS